jgi:opacity protein-like surface antigen
MKYMKKIIVIAAVIAALSAPAAAYASQSAAESVKTVLGGTAVQEYKVDNHEYRQQLWMDSSDNIHSNEPQLWL